MVQCGAVGRPTSTLTASKTVPVLSTYTWGVRGEAMIVSVDSGGEMKDGSRMEMIDVVGRT